MEHFYYVYAFTDGPYSSREYNKKTLQIANIWFNSEYLSTTKTEKPK